MPRPLFSSLWKNKIKHSHPSSREAVTTWKIKCITAHPKANADVTCQCCVSGRNRNRVSLVTWFKGLFPTEEEVENKDYEDGSGFTSCVTSKTEKQNEECRIRCEISTEFLLKFLLPFEETYILKLDWAPLNKGNRLSPVKTDLHITVETLGIPLKHLEW